MRIMGWFLAINGIAIGVSAGCDSDTDSDTSTGSSGTGGGLVEDAGTISGLTLINPNCGVGDDSTVSQACVDCAAEHCEPEFNACFGSDWLNDLDNGVCSTFGACVEACDCGDNACFNVCLQDLDDNHLDPCRSCIVTLIECEQTHCAEECDDLTGNTDAGTGGSGGEGGQGSSSSGSGSGSGGAGNG